MSPFRLHARLLAVLAGSAAACGDCGPSTIKTTPDIAVDERSLDFGCVPVLNTRELTVLVRSVGRAPLTIDELRIEEPGAAFSVEPLQGDLLVLAAGEQRGIPVRFVPPDEKAYTATLLIHSDAFDTSLQTIEIRLAGCGSTKACIEAPAAIAFGLVCESAGSVQQFAVNAGCTADLVVEDIRFEAGSSAAFAFLSSTNPPVTVVRGKAMTLAVTFQPKPGSTADQTGTIAITSTDPANRVVKIPVTATVNRAPTPTIKTPPNAAPGQTVTLDGTDSTDPDGHLPLTCSWKVASKPLASVATPDPVQGMTTSLKLDLPGPYAVALTCSDALGCKSSVPGSVDLFAKPAEQLYVELVWDNDRTDLDLHLLASPAAPLFGSQDCWFGNRHPDFGIQGDPTDDPILVHDALAGFGPELVAYAKPPQATAKYAVVVHFFKTNGAATPNTEAAVRVYEFGLIKSETKRLLTAAGQKWAVVNINWPSGDVEKVDTVTQ